MSDMFWVVCAALCATPLALLAIALAALPNQSELNLFSMPADSWLYLQAIKAALTKRNGHTTIQQRTKRIQVSVTRPVTILPSHVAAFRRLAEFSDSPPSPEVPVMYFIVMCFRLIIQAMILPAFPYSVLGSVLKNHSSTLMRPVSEGDRLLFRVFIESDAWRTTAKGDKEVDIVSEARSYKDNTIVWRAVTTAIILNPKRNKTASQSQQVSKASAEGTWTVAATWRLPGNVGRRYGALNGDLNPIHLFPATSRLFGFKRPIAHALFLVARAEASLRSHGVPLVAPVTLAAEFHRPTLLPATLLFSLPPAPAAGNSAEQEGGVPGNEQQFAVLTQDKAKNVITGSVGREIA